MKISVPKEVKKIVKKLNENGHKAYPVGGCVRDALLRKKPKDWDIATDAKPEEVQKIFPESVYENKFGTVGVKTDSKNDALKIIEVTTFRIEGKYSDKRHPDKIKFSDNIEKDLSRRDFTINAMALKLDDNEVIDPFNGQEDLKKKLIRTVGDPKKRFEEDALRLMRAARLATELKFKIEKETAEAIKENANLLDNIAKERIRDEFIKIIMADKADEGVRLLEKLNLLKFIMPELREGIGCQQSKHHIYTVWEHNVRALKYAALNNYPFRTRLASLLHDVGKPRTKEGEGEEATFYNHEVVGAKMTKEILERLKFPKELTEKVTHLVRHHLFYYNVGEVTETGVRRFLRRVGPENVPDLIEVRKADRIGSGVPKAVPYKLRHFLFMMEKVKRDPISTGMLKVDGKDVMKVAKTDPGPKVGQIMSILLEEVIEDPDKNKKKHLRKRIEELSELPDKKLQEMAKGAKKTKKEVEKEKIKSIKRKYHVK